MKFKEYLQAIASGDVEKYIISRFEKRSKLDKMVAGIAMKKLTSGKQAPKAFHLETNINNLVFGQFIMIETALTIETDAANKLFKVAYNILRPIEHEVFDNEDILAEKQHREAVLDSEASEVLFALNEFMKARDEFLNVRHAGVFYKLPSTDEDEEEEEEDKHEVKNVDNDNMYWYSLVRVLSNKDVHKYSDTYMLPMSTVAPEISYLKKEEQKREYENKVQELKRKAKSGTN